MSAGSNDTKGVKEIPQTGSTGQGWPAAVLPPPPRLTQI